MLLCILLHVVDHYKQFLNASRKVRLTMRQYIIVVLFLRLFKVHLRKEEIFVKKKSKNRNECGLCAFGFVFSLSSNMQGTQLLREQLRLPGGFCSS